LAAYLRQGGARVMMTREEDTDLSDPEITGLYAKEKTGPGPPGRFGQSFTSRFNVKHPR